jgi:epsilon-lactone hydrolase
MKYSESMPFVKGGNSQRCGGSRTDTMGFTLHGRLAFRWRSLRTLLRAAALVSLRRAARGPLVEGWTWRFEVTTRFMRDQMRQIFSLPDLSAAREYQDSLVFNMPALRTVQITELDESSIKGRWFVPRTDLKPRTVLYFHGGGYAFYTRAHDNLIVSVANATQARLLALDYPLAPEHAYPAQLEDALNAYRWLLAQGCAPGELIVAGDSAGGNLVLATLLGLRDLGLPQPALAVGLCPWTNLGLPVSSLKSNATYDWIEGYMAAQCAEWYCGNSDPADPKLSPVYADLRGLAPIYLQNGGKEILQDMITDFAQAAAWHGADVTLDTWENMNHDFHAYGDLVAESREAYARLRVMADQYCELQGKLDVASCLVPNAELASFMGQLATAIGPVGAGSAVEEPVEAIPVQA